MVASGFNSSALLNVPVLPAGLTYVDIAVGLVRSLALRGNGTIAAWGTNSTYGQLSVPSLPAGMSNVKIVAGGYSNLALRSDGVLIPVETTPSGRPTCPCCRPA